jgi:hypothetical protein
VSGPPYFLVVYNWERAFALPTSPSERSRWCGGRYRVPDAGGIGDSRGASLKQEPPRWGGYVTLKLFQSSMVWDAGADLAQLKS